MPNPNTIRRYYPNTFYHLYNRGNHKLPIFFNHQEYLKFLAILKFLLTSDNKTADSLKIFAKPRRKEQNFSKKIALVSFVLMPNHFHMIIYAKDPKDIEKFMGRLSIKYTQIVNSNHNLVGRLFQGVYKARPILSEIDLTNTSAYIHLNPNELTPDNSDYYLSYPYSSLSKNHTTLGVINFDLLTDKADISLIQYHQYLLNKSKNFVEMQMIKKHGI
ncbi:transposase [Candidatus Saccharibacteria bacterium]|nr:transposase [Candidatus Saccharibacteria bacterium]MCB9835025.1 transposase [Candidatus Nomurabacteria bacterium]